MNSTSNLKDTVTTICGIIIFIAGSVVTLEKSGVSVSPLISQISMAAGVIAGSVMAYFTGKNPDGSTKSTDQVVNQNNQSK